MLQEHGNMYLYGGIYMLTQIHEAAWPHELRMYPINFYQQYYSNQT